MMEPAANDACGRDRLQDSEGLRQICDFIIPEMKYIFLVIWYYYRIYVYKNTKFVALRNARCLG